MKNMLVVAAVLALASPTLSGQETSPKPQATRPIAALAWLVGGVWTADASKMGGGMQRIETRYTWSDNNAYIRFNTHFVTDKATIRNYDGQFFWNPEQSTLAMWYMDARGTIIQGTAQVDGEVTQFLFRATDFEGKMADLRVNVTRKTNDHYTWMLEEQEPPGWTQLASLEYLRVTEK